MSWRFRHMYDVLLPINVSRRRDIINFFGNFIQCAPPFKRPWLSFKYFSIGIFDKILQFELLFEWQQLCFKYFSVCNFIRSALPFEWPWWSFKDFSIGMYTGLCPMLQPMPTPMHFQTILPPTGPYPRPFPSCDSANDGARKITNNATAFIPARGVYDSDVIPFVLDDTTAFVLPHDTLNNTTALVTNSPSFSRTISPVPMCIFVSTRSSSLLATYLMQPAVMPLDFNFSHKWKTTLHQQHFPCSTLIIHHHLGSFILLYYELRYSRKI